MKFKISGKKDFEIDKVEQIRVNDGKIWVQTEKVDKETGEKWDDYMSIFYLNKNNYQIKGAKKVMISNQKGEFIKKQEEIKNLKIEEEKIYMDEIIFDILDYKVKIV